MATAAQIIERALQDAKIFAAGETVSGTADETYALRHLNDMLAEWEIDGIDLAPVVLTTSSTIDVPASHEGAIIANLAVRLIVSGFGGQLDPGLKFHADKGYERLRAYHFTIADLTDENPLSRDNLSTND